MTTPPDRTQALLQMLTQIYDEHLPFNQVLGLRVDRLTLDAVRTVFEMKPELIGNTVQGTLHGGVISAALDATGGIMATAGIIRKMVNSADQEIIDAFSKVGTIDVRIDYLRPGRGKRFIADGLTMRTGNKVAVTRTELHNNDGLLIAVGTGTYIVG